MHVIVIRMREPASAGADYPVTFHTFLPDLGQYQEEVLATGSIPFDLGNSRHSVTLDDLLIGYHDAYLTDADQSRLAAAEIGARLRGLLKDAWAGATVIESCEGGCAEDEHLRVYFDIEPRRLSRLPWELIDSGGVRAFVHHELTGHTCLRGRPDSVGGSQPGVARLPIKVLVVTGSTDPDLHVEEEVHAVYRALRASPGIWRVHVMRTPIWDDVVGECARFQPDIFHVIGHRGPNGGTQVGADVPWELHAQQLADLFPPGAPGGRLVILNSCDSVDLIPQEWLRAKADRAIVVTSGDIGCGAAARFAQAFYLSLARDGCVVKAAGRGRRDLVTRLPNDWHEWGLVRLHATGRPDRIIPHDLDRLSTRHRVETIALALQAPQFDRVQEHRRIWEIGEAGRRPRVALVAGRKDVGKTALVKSCLLTWRLDGRTVVYADMALGNGSRIPLSAAVKRIRKGLAGCLVPDPSCAPEAERDDDVERELRPEDLTGLTSSLEAWPTAELPLLLVIDHAEEITDGGRLFTEHFLTPVAQRPEINARVIIVSDSELTQAVDAESFAVGPLLSDDWKGESQRIDIADFRGDQLVPSARELLARLDIDHSRNLESYADSFGEPTQPWPPATLIINVGSYVALTKREGGQ